MKTKRLCVTAICGALLFIGAAVLSLGFGSVTLSPTEIISALIKGEDTPIYNVIIYSRLPRTLGALLAGAALAVAGAVLQNVLSNKLASPGIIGVNAGAGLGVTLCCAAGLMSGLAVSAAAFLGGIGATLIIALFAGRTTASKTTVILGGVALNSLLNAASESVAVLNPDVAMLSTEFRVGGFSFIGYGRLIPAAVIIVLTLGVLFTLFNELDITALGDETARSLGLSAKKYRVLFLILSALLAGAAVSFAGLLGFVGLIVPHFVRSLIGNESRRLLPLSALFGGGFVCLCDGLSRLIFDPYELPVGILMAVIGGPVFVLILIKLKGGRTDA